MSHGTGDDPGTPLASPYLVSDLSPSSDHESLGPTSPQPTLCRNQQHTIDDLFNTGCVLRCVSECVCRMLFAITALNHCNETVECSTSGNTRLASHTEGTRPPKPPRPPINQSCYRLTLQEERFEHRARCKIITTSLSARVHLLGRS
uniref:Uncharacterized protein n=1 Tax=Anopheles merus TaxID=30066 RepID=A0A182V8C3_ANOME